MILDEKSRIHSSETVIPDGDPVQTYQTYLHYDERDGVVLNRAKQILFLFLLIEEYWIICCRESTRNDSVSLYAQAAIKITCVACFLIIAFESIGYWKLITDHRSTNVIATILAVSFGIGICLIYEFTEPSWEKIIQCCMGFFCLMSIIIMYVVHFPKLGEVEQCLFMTLRWVSVILYLQFDNRNSTLTLYLSDIVQIILLF